MKKIVLNEQQVQKLMTKVVEEQVPAIKTDNIEINDGRSQIDCEFHIDADEYTTYQNGQIDDFNNARGIISYMLDINYQPYGIQDISIKDVKYPPVIEATIRYFPEGHSSEDEDWYETRKEEQIKIPIDWKKTKHYNWDDDKHVKYIGIDKKVNVEVKPDGKGGLIGYVPEIDVREYHGDEDAYLMRNDS